ncbi:tellurite resistance TerB C-terminal domain-containing protein, partial [Alistipes communis]|uniref:tellurite resistance TerB C-terminal domain-containing protein n=1 Tax=Alistipes communis TaxID=2585118 RepID=UPI003077C930
SDIFVEEESATPQNTEIDNATSAWMEVLKSLLTKEVWERTEVDSMCKERGLMLGAVLEQINDFAYEKVDDAVIEDDGENIYVTMDYKEHLI